MNRQQPNQTRRGQMAMVRWIGGLCLAAFVLLSVACGPTRGRSVLIPPTDTTSQGGTDTTGQEDPSDFGITFANAPQSGTDRTATPAPAALCAARGGRCGAACPTGTRALRGMADCARVGGICCVPTNPECRTDADCGSSGKCTQQGTACYQLKPFCHYGRCYRRAFRTAGTCDAQTGQCQTAPPQCGNNADCGRPACKQSGSMCVASLPQCNSGQCGRREVTIRGTCQAATGTCQVAQDACRADSDCGKPSCFDRDAYCYQLRPACTNGQCRPQISRIVGTCHQASGTCVANQPKCTTNGDCGQPTCKQDGTTCVQNIPLCTNGSCTGNSRRLSHQTCNGRTGKCEVKQTPQCQTDADCRSSCTQQGSDCIAYTSTCQGGFCTSAPKVITGGTCDAQSGQCQQAPQPTNCGMNQMEQEVLRLVNVERNNAGQPPLNCHAALVTGARSWSQEQCRRGRISHDNFQSRVKATGVSYVTAGENVAAGQSTAAQVVNAWMNSSGHRRNILSANFTHLGVGYYNCGQGFKHFWTQIFVGIR